MRSAILVVMLLGYGSTRGESLPDELRSLLEEPRFQQSHWGLLFVDQESGEVLLEQDADRLFVPASTTKLYSVAAALDELGPDFCFKTRLYATGKRDDERLEGNLILRASGDLTMGGRTTVGGEIAFANGDHTYANGSLDSQLTEPDPLAGLNALARQVAESGIKRVQGDVLIDDRLFDKAESTGSGPSQLTPIIINDNIIDLTIEPTQAGQPAKVTMRPETSLFRLENDLETSATGTTLETRIRHLGGGRLYLAGRIPEGHKPVLRIMEVPDPASFARSLLIEALQRVGVAVDAAAFADHPPLPLPDSYDGLAELAALTSPPFSESARLILKVSHNLHASTLPLIIASRHGERTLRDGLRRQHDFLARAGVDVETISFGGGAGGARADHVTPRATVQLLKHMTTRPDFATYLQALPRLGVDGTLATAASADNQARDKVFAKTGTLSWENVMNGRTLLTSKALAGYLRTARGRNLIFAAFVNNVHLRNGVDARSVGRDLGKVCDIVHRQY
ncbi:MAG: D-alanyl-D-alanine carboxypeptidase/D-alanyl-D-alanine-endopeptidase [Planctomycetes bacterium]|nr:D-alanyl-D-alanine carboxypeptidase/D-alanyl-D-alanine-endopeptidase [Planctomycetota bacterium]